MNYEKIYTIILPKTSSVFWILKCQDEVCSKIERFHASRHKLFFSHLFSIFITIIFNN